MPKVTPEVTDVELMAINLLGSLAQANEMDVRLAAARGLSRYIHRVEAVNALSSLLQTSDTKVREVVALALGGKV